MRFITVRIAWLGIATAAVAAASACVPVERNTVEVARVQIDTVGMQPVATPEFFRADPEEVAARAFVGGMVGGMLGAGFAAIASANPAFGAVIGGPAGAVIGVVVGIATTPPLPSYAPIAVPAAPVIPEFYDTWPPGYAFAADRSAGAAAAARVEPGAAAKTVPGEASASADRRSRPRSRRPLRYDRMRRSGPGRLHRAPPACPLPRLHRRLACLPLGAPPITASRALPFAPAPLCIGADAAFRDPVSRSRPGRDRGRPVAIRWYALAYIAGLLLGWRYCLALADRPPHLRAHGATSTISWSGQRSASSSAAGSAMCCSTIRPTISRTRSRRSISGTAGCRFTAARSA